MIRTKFDAKKFVIKYASCAASMTLCYECHAVKNENGTVCTTCAGTGILAYVWTIHVAA